MQDAHSRYIKGLKPHQATTLSVAQILSIGKQGLETLHHELHIKGLIHQDLHLENIAYDATTDRAVIYGLRHAINQPASQQEFSEKTVSYQSPEQVLELPFNATVDVWMLGAILFELYTGTQLIPIVKPTNRTQAIGDFWHMIIQNLGPLPEGYLDKAWASPRSYFKTGDSNDIAYPASPQTQQLMKTFEDIAKEYPSIPLWQSRIYAAAKQKGEPKTQAKSLIIFLSRMLRYEEERTTAANALQRLAILHKAEQEEGKRDPRVRAPLYPSK
jgi:serine/threonine protein kinase